LVTRLREGEVSVESIGQTAFLAVAWPREAKPTPPGAAENTVGQNRAKALPREVGWSISAVEIGEAKRKFRLAILRSNSDLFLLARKGLVRMRVFH
jgi:hypothetical protein